MAERTRTHRNGARLLTVEVAKLVSVECPERMPCPDGVTVGGHDGRREQGRVDLSEPRARYGVHVQDCTPGCTGWYMNIPSRYARLGAYLPPAVPLPEPPTRAHRAVPPFGVGDAPAHLPHRGAVVELRRGVRLKQPIRPGLRVAGVRVPPALTAHDGIEAGVLRRSEPSERPRLRSFEGSAEADGRTRTRIARRRLTRVCAGTRLRRWYS